MRITIKPDPDEIQGAGYHIVLADGELVGKLWWNRWMVWDGPGRQRPRFQGELTNVKTGEVTDISCYCWFSDVRRWVPYHLGLEG